MTAEEDAEQKALEDAVFEARSAWRHSFKAMPWQAAMRHLTELSIAAIQAERLANEADEGDLSEVVVTLGGLAGAWHALLYDFDGPSTVMISDSALTVHEALICLVTEMRQNYTVRSQGQVPCLCRVGRPPA